MDADRLWRELRHAVRSGDREMASERADALLDWLAHGGLPPSFEEDADAESVRAKLMQICRAQLGTQGAHS